MRVSVVSVFLLALGGSASAQGYIESVPGGGLPYGFVDISQSGTPLSLSLNSPVAAIQPGFSFPFFGQQVSADAQLFVKMTGEIDLVWGAGPDAFVSLWPRPQGSIAAFRAPYSSALGWYWEVQGAPGSRILIVEWHFAVQGNNPRPSFEVKIYEATGQIELAYGDSFHDNPVTSTGEIGLRSPMGQGMITHMCSGHDYCAGTTLFPQTSFVYTPTTAVSGTGVDPFALESRPTPMLSIASTGTVASLVHDLDRNGDVVYPGYVDFPAEIGFAFLGSFISPTATLRARSDGVLEIAGTELAAIAPQPPAVPPYPNINADRIYTSVAGMGGSRTLTIEWFNARRFDWTMPGDIQPYFASYQIRIHEGSGQIEYIYGPYFVATMWDSSWLTDAKLGAFTVSPLNPLSSPYSNPWLLSLAKSLVFTPHGPAPTTALALGTAPALPPRVPVGSVLPLTFDLRTSASRPA